jgi:hypothetical protein
MAWRSSGNTNEELIENLSRNGLIKYARVKAAFLKVRGCQLPTLKPTTTAWTFFAH